MTRDCRLVVIGQVGGRVTLTIPGARFQQIGSGFDQVWTMLNISGTIADIIEFFDLINIKVLSILLQLVSCNVCLVVKGFLYNSSYKAKGNNGCANPG